MRKLRRAEAGLSASALHSGKAHQSFPRGGQLQAALAQQTGEGMRGRGRPGLSWERKGEVQLGHSSGTGSSACKGPGWEGGMQTGRGGALSGSAAVEEEGWREGQGSVGRKEA